MACIKASVAVRGGMAPIRTGILRCLHKYTTLGSAADEPTRGSTQTGAVSATAPPTPQHSQHPVDSTQASSTPGERAPLTAGQAAAAVWEDDVNPITKERGGPKGPEPTRFGDWERKGRVSDF